MHITIDKQKQPLYTSNHRTQYLIKVAGVPMPVNKIGLSLNRQIEQGSRKPDPANLTIFEKIVAEAAKLGRQTHSTQFSWATSLMMQ